MKLNPCDNLIALKVEIREENNFIFFLTEIYRNNFKLDLTEISEILIRDSLNNCYFVMM